jgi:hypothetical protein
MGEYADAMMDGDVETVHRLARQLEAQERWISRESALRQQHHVKALAAYSPVGTRLGIDVNANGAHWQGRLDGKVIAEWWPGTGRLIVLGRHKDKKEYIHDAVLFAHVCVVIAEAG